ncbi:hypothetical protein [Wolbachia endosymbiont (group A) of Clivina fossor]|uniref:hypothetical protein n=1 Tax=Wolbachia endosymbiont (group A) of Clivina fossor TaxID=3066133 RepID=UPI0031334AAB
MKLRNEIPVSRTGMTWEGSTGMTEESTRMTWEGGTGMTEESARITEKSHLFSLDE